MKRSTLWFSVAFTFLVFYIGMIGATISHTSHMAHTQMPLSECPFSFSQDSLCAKNMFEYLETLSWDTRTFFAGLFLVLVSSLVIFRVSLRQFQLRYIQSYSPPLYQTLFSDGILHPKAP